jgi:hypothetical protein
MWYTKLILAINASKFILKITNYGRVCLCLQGPMNNSAGAMCPSTRCVKQDKKRRGSTRILCLTLTTVLRKPKPPEMLRTGLHLWHVMKTEGKGQKVSFRMAGLVKCNTRQTLSGCTVLEARSCWGFQQRSKKSPIQRDHKGSLAMTVFQTPEALWRGHRSRFMEAPLSTCGAAGTVRVSKWTM